MTFDMQKARAVCEKATLGPWVAWGGRITHVGKFAGELFNAGLYCRQEDIMFVVGARTLLPAALDRIEEQAKRIAELDAEAQSYHDRKEEFAGRIAELEAENERLRQWGISNATDAAQEKVKGEKLRTTLKKLGKALTEERALAIECNPNRTREWTHEQAIERARDQLRQEGAIR